MDQTAPPKINGLTAAEGGDPTSEALLNWTAAANAGNRQGDSAPLSPWATYRVYYTDDDSEPTNTSPYVDEAVNAGLANMGTASVTLSNLVFDTTYKFRIAGRDEAGNEGPLSDTATIVLPGFNVTQGVVRVTGGRHPVLRDLLESRHEQSAAGSAGSTTCCTWTRSASTTACPTSGSGWSAGVRTCCRTRAPRAGRRPCSW